MPSLRLFAAAREAAGVARAEFDGETVAEMLQAAEASFGDRFSAVLRQSRVWVNGEPATGETPVSGHDVVAVLPPVSGGAGEVAVMASRPEPSPPQGKPIPDYGRTSGSVRLPSGSASTSMDAPMAGMEGGSGAARRTTEQGQRARPPAQGAARARPPAQGAARARPPAQGAAR
ncbi:MAG: MoaD/ThiS family protein, partial [Acidimicrobiales bacterium]